MDSTSEPLAKRRKLSRHDSSVLVGDERFLVSLARASLDVELVDEVIAQPLEEPLESKPVILESAVIHGNALIIGLHFSDRKDLLHLKSFSPRRSRAALAPENTAPAAEYPASDRAVEESADSPHSA